MRLIIRWLVNACLILLGQVEDLGVISKCTGEIKRRVSLLWFGSESRNIFLWMVWVKVMWVKFLGDIKRHLKWGYRVYKRVRVRL